MRALHDEPSHADEERLERACRRAIRVLEPLRFKSAPTVEQCLAMLGELEGELGGERRAAAVVGPSVITVRSWKRRRTMSMPARRLVWMVWALLFEPNTLKTADDLVAWGRLHQSRRGTENVFHWPADANGSEGAGGIFGPAGGIPVSA
jgi:hypothetical protein